MKRFVRMLGISTAWIALSAQAQTYRMGTATVDVTPRTGVPLAGYGGVDRRIVPWDFFQRFRYAHFFKPSKGVHDPIRSKAMVVELGSERILFVSIDVVGVDKDFMADLRRYAEDVGIQHIVISATHTHSGPGALGRNAFYSVLATDRFEPKVYGRFLNGVLDSIDAALASLKPVRLYSADFTADGMQRNRRDRPGVFDPIAHLLIGKDESGGVVGGMLNYAIHPTVFGEENLHFSADVGGGLERALKARLGSQGDILFVNGAEGDVSPNIDDGFEGIERKSAGFAEAAAQAIAGASEMPMHLKVRKGWFRMPRAKLALGACGKKIKKLLGKLRIPLGRRSFPVDFELSQIELGNALMMTWPGEPTTDLGLESQQIAREAGYAGTAWNLGLTNGYMGYFVTESEYDAGGYEVCVAYHGKKAGRTILNNHRELLRW